MVTPWKFDSQVAANFADHAKKHIPNYHQVIQQTVDVCQQLLPVDAKIVDVGCAIGETLRKLHLHGFINLYGVDSSQEMLNHCDNQIAQLACQTTWPKHWGYFDAVICNWTLHFIENKDSYLTEISRSVDDSGLLILTDKISLDPALISLYHQEKFRAGVNKQEIELKEKQIQDIMFINSRDWYLDILNNLGFSKIDIINAGWCFNTFLARR
jgi:ubiquinone/menaquinone biosynthesis C-methylase UbiE